MMYFAIAFLLVIGFFVLYKIFVSVGEPDMELTGVMTHDELLSYVAEIANKASVSSSGSVFSLYLINKTIKSAYKIISKKVGSKKCLEHEKWIYDNYYKLEELINEQKRLMVAYNKLPCYKDAPRVFRLAEAIVKGCGGAINEEAIVECVKTFNEITPLTFSEITMLMDGITLALLEYVAIFCARSIVVNKRFALAQKDIALSRINIFNIRHNSYAYAFTKYADGNALKRFVDVCSINGIDAYKKADRFLSACAKADSAVCTTIKSLHLIKTMLSDEAALRLCPLNNYLENTKGIVYKKCTTQTKYIYLQNIAKKAKNKSEIFVARQIIKKSIKSGKDIAFYILRKPFGKVGVAIYSLIILLNTISNCMTAYSLAPQYKIFAAILFAPISLSIVLMFLNAVSSLIFSPRYMPRAKVGKGVKAMIVFPVLVFSASEVDEMVDNLLTAYYANQEDIFSFGLLIDLPVSYSDELSNEDILIIKRAKERFSSLPKNFNLFIRKRSKVDGETKFQGWEKKRGAIIDLNKLIMSDINSNFEIVQGTTYNVDYVVTLDGDTIVNCAYELVEIMEHPYNENKAVVGLNVKTHPQKISSYFSALMSDDVGLNSYSNNTSNINYDLFDSGNYTGKGIYRVRKFTLAVANAFMENRILSHDFVEGALSGCGSSGLCALDAFPNNFSSFLSRNLRWLRGDIQLLPLLARSQKNSSGIKQKSKLSFIAKLHILCNIILGFSPVFSMILLIVSLFSSAPLMFFVGAFAYNLLIIIGALRGLFRQPKRVGLELGRQALNTSCLPTNAYNYAKAILVTVYRLIVKKNLLEWNVSAHSNGKISFAPNVFATIVFGVAFGVSGSYSFLFAAIWFAFGIIYAKMLGKCNEKSQSVSQFNQSYLKKIAADTWIYFEKQLSEENSYLPYDNYQEYADVGYAKRTSPTDIAFGIVALVCAKKMDFIVEKEFNFYAEKILDSIEKAEKWKGNLYNWLDIFSLNRLNGYVSAVDSGNLLASLILLRNFSHSAEVRSRANELIKNTDLNAFFDNNRGLLLIGYNDDDKTYDSNHYDLLGSESMLTYLVGIGTGKLKAACFENLSRRCVKFKGSSLYSWTGGAFEYMMSSIFFKYYRGGMLYNSAKSVLRANIAYCKKMKLPFWGISESQYARVDEWGNYQYKAFGVPNISLTNERRIAVASPYSSMLFLPYFTKSVSKNVKNMCKMGLKGEDGLYEAYDNEIIKTYMAHHQGMILASICSYFYPNSITKSFSSPDMRAAELRILLNDCASGEKKRIYEPFDGIKDECVKVEDGFPPKINLLTNGKYSVFIDGLGNGYSYFDGKYVTRYYDYDGGMKLFANICGKRIDIQRNECKFGKGKVIFIYRDSNVEISQTAYVLPMLNGEVRSISVRNISNRAVDVALESYIEIALTPLYHDIAHKTFSGMFVTTEYNATQRAIIARRDGLYLAHYFDCDAKYQSNRGNFFGRTQGNEFGRVLDPIAHGKVELNLSCGEQKTFAVYNLVNTDYDVLVRQIQLTKRVGFLDKAIFSKNALANGFGIGEKLKDVASKLTYQACANLVDGDLPLICIETNVVTHRIRQKFALLSKLALFGIRVRVVVIYCGNDYIKEQISESLLGLVGANCELSIVRDGDDVAQKARESATNIDEIIFHKFAKPSVCNKAPYAAVVLPKIEYAYKLGKGGFLDDGSYVIEFDARSLTPRPWSNIIASKSFGSIITESGGGYVYYKNSSLNKLTEWSNDPVLDKCSEGIVMIEDGVSWSCTYQPVKADCKYQVIHGFGYTEFRSNYNGFYAKQREYVVANAKYYELTLTSYERRDRVVDVIFYVLPVLGDFKFKTGRNLRAKFDGKLCVENLFNKNRFFVSASKKIDCYVCHKQSYIDKNGQFFVPFGEDVGLFAPAIKIRLYVPSLCSERVVFCLSADEKAEVSNGVMMLNSVKRQYEELSCIELKSGNEALDYLCKWLPYQIVCSRFFGRTGFYQAGGAIGFRDQLQDCLGVLYVSPTLVREHILTCAAHQFEQGDVMHWWHEPSTGVRTKISDDRLFLPFITAEYIEFTGDEGILMERVSYLSDVKILGKDYYGTIEPTAKTGTLLEHCLKAIKASAKLGENGLVLMGSGDWNDAMDKVGALGKGTTVWGSMFLYMVIGRFLPYVKNKKPYLELRDRLRESIDRAWDGEWYARAYCDDGTVLGSKHSKECNIDLITQSFAAISGVGDKSKTKLAILSAANRLVDSKVGIIKLLDPPFENIDAGYISDYPKGVRENGGQYTHGAVWYIMSLFEIGEIEYAYALLNMINPINHSLTCSAVNKYEVEPYVVSADVYSEPSGKGGWSWYTGAAAWYYYVVVRCLFGIKITKDTITVNPSMPKSIKKASFSIKKDGLIAVFNIDNEGEGEWKIFVNSRGYNTNSIKLSESLKGKEITLKKTQ